MKLAGACLSIDRQAFTSNNAQGLLLRNTDIILGMLSFFGKCDLYKFLTTSYPCKIIHTCCSSYNVFFCGYNYSIVLQVLSYDGLHPPDSLAITAAGIAMYAVFVLFLLNQGF